MVDKTSDADDVRWPITDADRQALVTKLLAIAAGVDIPMAIDACEILVLMDGQNQLWESGADERAQARLRESVRTRGA